MAAGRALPAALRGRGEGSAARSRGLRGGRSVCGGGRSCALGGAAGVIRKERGAPPRPSGAPARCRGGGWGWGVRGGGRAGLPPLELPGAPGRGSGAPCASEGSKRLRFAFPGAVLRPRGSLLPAPGFSSSSGVLWALNRAAELSVEEGVLGVVSRVQPLGMGM